MNRREFFGMTIGVGMSAVAASALPADKFRWACTSGMFAGLKPQPEATLATISRHGYHGLEATAQLTDSAGSIAGFKRALDQCNLKIAAFRGGGTYWDPANPGRVRETVDQNIGLARDYVAPAGGTCLKVNLNQRSQAHPRPNLMTPADMQALAETLNEIGRGTKAHGVRFAFHPRAWTLVESGWEIQQVMNRTDPALVYLIADTAHLTLGGNDPVKIVRDWHPRIVGVHFKDTDPKYSVSQTGWKGPSPSQAEHKAVSLYRDFGTGGVNFVGVIKVLRDKAYDSWISLDFDPLRPGEGEVESVMARGTRFITGTLKASLRSGASVGTQGDVEGRPVHQVLGAGVRFARPAPGRRSR